MCLRLVATQAFLLGTRLFLPKVPTSEDHRLLLGYGQMERGFSSSLPSMPSYRYVLIHVSLTPHIIRLPPCLRTC
ncbi:hypothetical protein FA13DRAFT_1741678 [Coprinellus micaceus]|uniref:Secreted protein n=1 Tax=Coprinellus micaceus TaxID=71717 RepID=A0A4Y7SGK0_COPMI|nr:hypothetical protein FA13DRAFT_1742484 [Coprinellus micaceus]TEB21735.1 hypothetical protein FA13DRAFT_1741678 [Coprinellus micaceus]